MAQIGYLGDIIFCVSPREIKTLQSVKWSSTANIQSHSRHLNKGLAEYTGSEPDSITFNMMVTRYLGSDPQSDIATLRGYIETGKIVSFVLGSTVYGSYRWLVKKISNSFEHYDKTGNLVSAKISVTLTEYAKE